MYSRDDVELALYALEEGMGARGAAELVGCGVFANVGVDETLGRFSTLRSWAC